MKKKIFSKKTNPHRESLERQIKDNEAYLETLVAGTDEYKKCQEAVFNGYEQLRKMDEHKIKASDVLPWVTLAVTAVAGIFVPVYGMNKAYQKEEVDNDIPNGRVWTISQKSKM